MLSGINEPAIAKQRRKSESQMIASEWEGEGKILYKSVILEQLMLGMWSVWKLNFTKLYVHGTTVILTTTCLNIHCTVFTIYSSVLIVTMVCVIKWVVSIIVHNLKE